MVGFFIIATFAFVPLTAIGTPAWANTLIFLAIFLLAKSGGLLHTGVWIWAVVKMLRGTADIPTTWFPVLFWVLFAIQFVPNVVLPLVSAFSKHND